MGSAPATPTVGRRGAAIRRVPKRLCSCAETGPCDGMLPALWGRRPPSASAHRKIRARDDAARWRRSAARSPSSPSAARLRAADKPRQDADEPSGDFPVNVTVGEVRHRSAPRRDQRPDARDREHGRRGGPGPRGDDLHRRPEGGRAVLGPLRPARSRGPQPPGLDPGERLSEGREARRVQRPARRGARRAAPRPRRPTPSPSARSTRATAATSSGG